MNAYHRIAIIGCLIVGIAGDVFAGPKPTKSRKTPKTTQAEKGRTNPDGHKINNYSFKGNTNPKTGKRGTVVQGPRRVKGKP